MTDPRSSLARYQLVEPADEDHLRRMRAAAWHGQGVAVLRPDEIANEWLRQAVKAEAERLYGRRAG